MSSHILHIEYVLIVLALVCVTGGLYMYMTQSEEVEAEFANDSEYSEDSDTESASEGEEEPAATASEPQPIDVSPGPKCQKFKRPKPCRKKYSDCRRRKGGNGWEGCTRIGTPKSIHNARKTNAVARPAASPGPKEPVATASEPQPIDVSPGPKCQKFGRPKPCRKKYSDCRRRKGGRGWEGCTRK